MIQQKEYPKKPDFILQEKYEIRELFNVKNAGTAHCVVYPVGISPVYKNEFDELWYILEGNGEIWVENHETTEFSANSCVLIPEGTSYQFRNPGNDLLKFFIVTVPKYDVDKQVMIEKNTWA